MSGIQQFYPRVFIISGPSGVGKSTIIRGLLQQVENLRLSTSVTSRHPRPGEINGKDYYFVNKDSFLKMIDQEDFIEWAHLFNNLYGTSRSEIDYILRNRKIHVLLDMDHQGMSQVTSRFSGAFSVFIAPPSFEELERRLRDRGTENDRSFEIRTASSRQEMNHMKEYDQVVVNEEVDEAIHQIVDLIRIEERKDVIFASRHEECGVPILDRAVLYALEMLESNATLNQLDVGVREALTHDVLLQIRKKMAEGFANVDLDHVVHETYQNAQRTA